MGETHTLEDSADCACLDKAVATITTPNGHIRRALRSRICGGRACHEGLTQSGSCWWVFVQGHQGRDAGRDKVMSKPAIQITCNTQSLSKECATILAQVLQWLWYLAREQPQDLSIMPSRASMQKNAADHPVNICLPFPAGVKEPSVRTRQMGGEIACCDARLRLEPSALLGKTDGEQICH